MAQFDPWSDGPTRRAGLLAAAAGVLLLAACEIPEEPAWEVSLSFPFTSDSLTTIDFLPERVDTATADGEKVFVVDLQEDSIAYRLADMCDLCKALHGETVTIPPFDFVDSLDVPFSPDIYSIEVREARLQTGVENNLNFDLVQQHSHPDSTGSIALAVRDIATGTTIDSVMIVGATGELPPDSTREIDRAVADVELSEGFRVVLYVHSPPDTQVVTIDTTRVVNLQAKLDQIVVRGVTVVVDDKEYEEDDRIVIDEQSRQELAERYVRGSLEVMLNHNVEVEGFLEMSLAPTLDDAFSGDPDREVRLGELLLTSQLVQTFGLSTQQIETFSTFPDTIFAVYRGRGSGTRTGPGGRLNLSRITPDLFFRTRLKLMVTLKVGG